MLFQLTLRLSRQEADTLSRATYHVGYLLTLRPEQDAFGDTGYRVARASVEGFFNGLCGEQRGWMDARTLRRGIGLLREYQAALTEQLPTLRARASRSEHAPTRVAFGGMVPLVEQCQRNVADALDLLTALQNRAEALSAVLDAASDADDRDERDAEQAQEGDAPFLRAADRKRQGAAFSEA
jgi:hypothetical protein